MPFSDGAAAADESASLGSEEPGRADDLLHLSRFCCCKCLWSRPALEHLRGDLVHARVGALGREDCRDKEFERVVMFELDPRRRAIPSKGLEERRKPFARWSSECGTRGWLLRALVHSGAILATGLWPVKKSWCSHGVPKSPFVRHRLGGLRSVAMRIPGSWPQANCMKYAVLWGRRLSRSGGLSAIGPRTPGSMPWQGCC